MRTLPRPSHGPAREGPLVRGSVPATTLITGGAGYIGALASRELLRTGRNVRVLDSLLHAQEPVAAELEEAGVQVIRGDVRDPAARELAIKGVDAVVHLAAIVGDPACARDPEIAAASQRRGSPRARRRGRAGRRRSASCSPRPARTTGGWPTRRCRSTRTARSAGLALRRAEGRDRAVSARPRRRPAASDLPALRDGLRRRAAHALRPHRQRVHARPVGGPRARGIRRAVLAPVRPRRATPRARIRTVLDAPARARRSRGLQRRATRARTTASSTSSRRSASRSARGEVTYVSATRIRATTRSASRRSAPSWASRRR